MAPDTMRVRLHLRLIRVLAVPVDTPTRLDVEVTSTRSWSRCPLCGFKTRAVHDTRRRKIRDLPVSGRRTTLVWIRRRCVCGNCDEHHLETHPCFEGGLTARLARQLVADAKVMSIRTVVRRHGIGWHQIQALVSGWSATVAAHRRSKRCRVLLVDETSMRRRHRYVTVVMNGETGQVLAMIEHRNAADLSSFFVEQGRRWCAGVDVVVTDGSKSYKAAIDAHLGGARHVLDRMLLLLSSPDGSALGEDLVDVACDVALEASHGFSACLAFADSAVDVGARGGVPPESNEDDPPQRHVRVAVAAAVEAVALLLARRCVQWRDAAQRGERCFGMQPFGVVAGRDQQRSSDVGADALLIEQPDGCCVVHDPLQFGFELRGLVVELLPTQRQAPHRRCVSTDERQTVAGEDRLDNVADRPAVEPLAKLVGCSDDQRVNLVGRGVACLDRRTPGQTQRAHHFDRPVGRFRGDEALAGQRCASSGFGIDGIGLSASAAESPVGSADLVHLDAGRRQLASQPKAIGAAPLDADRHQFAELGHPRSQLDISGQCCIECGDVE